MHRVEISGRIGVREPYLWLDEALEITRDRLVAIKRLDPSLPIFDAHFVQFPLFPGALQCEACFQGASLLIGYWQAPEPGFVPVIARVRNVKFKRMARPGDTLRIEVEIRGRTSRAIELHGRVSVEDETTTELDFIATEAPLPANASPPSLPSISSVPLT